MPGRSYPGGFDHAGASFVTWVLGINGSHNGSFCLMKDGRIVVAIQEERLTGLKRARVFGGRHSLGIDYCLNAAGIEPSDLDLVVLANQNSAEEVENDLSLNPNLRGLDGLKRRTVSHHLAHAASALGASGFADAAVLVCDGMGSPVSDLDAPARAALLSLNNGGSEHLSLYSAENTSLRPLEIHTTTQWYKKDGEGLAKFGSLGGMFAAVSQQIFGDATEAGKVMGLAPFGKPGIPVEEFLVFEGPHIRFPNLVGQRFPGDAIWPEQRQAYEELAASAQHALDVALLQVARHLRTLSGKSRLCMAGGVALNCVTNQLLYEQSGFEEIFIIPAAEDSGVAIGAAYLGWWELGGGRDPVQMVVDQPGAPLSLDEIDQVASSFPEIRLHTSDSLLDDVAQRLASGEIGSWVQGGSEFGPRALGQRSIIASPCLPDSKERLNARVKFREKFRPFAPVVQAEKASDWFDFGSTSCQSRHMLRIVPVRPEKQGVVPAIVHVDGTGRVQTVTAEEQPRLHALLGLFEQRTQVPMLVNTSFNVAGEPLVETAEDALWLLLGTGLDFCVVEDRLFTRADSFGSLLDFRPAIIAEEINLKLNIRDFRLAGDLRRDEDVTFRANTPWGMATSTLPLRLMGLVSAIDDKSSGHEILAGLELEDPQLFIHDLLRLRRMHVIELQRP